MSDASTAGVSSADPPSPGVSASAGETAYRPDRAWQRRWRVFRRDRRAMISLTLFGLISLLAFLAPLIANNNPLVVVHQGSVFFPAFETVSERDLGGQLPLQADFSEAAVQSLVGPDGIVVWPVVRFSYDTVDFYTWDRHPAAPSSTHPLGTDDQARDVLARVLYGLRISLWFGLLLTFITVSIGIAAGTVQGYFGGWIDISFQRFLEIWESMPQLYVLIIVSSVLVPSFLSLLILLSLFGWIGVVGIVRAEVLRVRKLDYVTAARAMGVPSWTIMARHVAPNALVAAMTMLPFAATGSIVSLASLDFLGFGLPTGSPSLGELLQQGRNNLNAPWLGISAFGSLAVLLTLLVFVGEGVRDAFDPRRARRHASNAGARRPTHKTTMVEETRGLLAVRGLSVYALTDMSRALVDDISFDIAPGEIIGLVGESGSGKSLTARSLLNIIPDGVTYGGDGQLVFDGVSVPFSSSGQASLRGRSIGFVPQEPMSSLNPVHTARAQLVEALKVGTPAIAALALEQAIMRLLRLVRLEHIQSRLGSYPHELSGGERQRLVIAMALANNPRLLVADEPTTALDVVLQAQILDLFARLRDELGIAILFVSHDLAAVSSLADRVLVMDQGRVVEEGAAEQILSSPKSAQAKRLVSGASLETQVKGSPATSVEKPDRERVALSTTGLTVRFALPSRGLGLKRRHLVAVDNVSLELRRGETLGLIGASGSGKSTLGRAVLNMLPHEGAVTYASLADGPGGQRSRQNIAAAVQIVFQDPFASLSPRMTVEDILLEPLSVHAASLSDDDKARMVRQALERVGLGSDSLHRYPHEFSGGQRQRIAIARALIVQPDVIVLDEPTSALDASVRAGVLEMLKSIQQQTGVAYILITHDFAVLARIADRIAVMKEGAVVETGSRSRLFNKPEHPYTQELLGAARRLNPALSPPEPFFEEGHGHD